MTIALIVLIFAVWDVMFGCFIFVAWKIATSRMPHMPLEAHSSPLLENDSFRSMKLRRRHQRAVEQYENSDEYTPNYGMRELNGSVVVVTSAMSEVLKVALAQPQYSYVCTETTTTESPRAQERPSAPSTPLPDNVVPLHKKRK
jgi:hypothetical protein